MAVRFFARYREATGRQRLEVDLPDGGTVEAAWAAVVDRHPELARYRPFTLFAIGNDYVSSDHALRPGDEVCLFPPVSGGLQCEPQPPQFEPSRPGEFVREPAARRDPS